MNSNRKYKVVGIYGKETVSQVYSLKELLTDDNDELTYTLQEDLDDILDLMEGQARYVRLSRDKPNELGVIKRIS